MKTIDKFVGWLSGEQFRCYFGGGGGSTPKVEPPPPAAPPPPSKEVVTVSNDMAKQNRRRVGVQSTILGGALGSDQNKSVLGG
jgi:hypothetical protein